MASTSLAQQLQKLSAPQSSVYQDTKQQVSLLFDPSQAALKDRDTFYEIGLSGLNELIALCPEFNVYQDTLFSITSKEFERAVQSKELNKNLDQTIEKFLLQLSPYFLLQSSHKALEWLINRYHIHQYNIDEVMTLILPYHRTMIFVRFVQLLQINKNCKQWQWLRAIKKSGVPLTSQVLFNQCVSNIGTFHFITKSVLTYIREYKDKSTQLNTVFAFYCQVCLGVIETSKKLTEPIVNALLPTVIKGIDSPIDDFRASSHIILGYMLTKGKIKSGTLKQILDKLLSTECDLSYDVLLIMVMMYEHQTHLTKMSDAIFNISIDTMSTVCHHLRTLVERKCNIQPFVLAFLKKMLLYVQSNIEEFKTYSQLPVILIDEVDLKTQDPEAIIRCILHAYRPKKDNNIADEDGSDIEIIEEDDFSTNVLNWYAILLKNVERQYPVAFDKVVKAEMSSDSNISSERQNHLSKLLGFKPAIAHKVRGTYLFENLNHINPDLRIEAVKYISKEFSTLKIQNPDFVKESIIDRMNDDNPDVVDSALDIENECLEELFNGDDISNIFITIISRKSKKWRSVLKKTIIKFCSLEKLPVNQSTVLAIVPLLFPHNDETTYVAKQIITSNWGQRFEVTSKIAKDLAKTNSTEISLRVFHELFVAKSVGFDDILDENLLNKNNTVDLCFYMLLKSCTFKNSTVQELSLLLSILLESVETRPIIQSSLGISFSYEIMPEFINYAKENKMLFEIIEYIFSRTIEDMNIPVIAKPWCNVVQTTEMILIRRLYEICITGCAIPSYGESYVKLLLKLLDKFCNDAKEKFEFIANFACGHILYAANPKDVIAPELQLRSLKLLINFLAIQDDAKWLYDSDVVILVVLLNLNNPISIIRECIIDMVIKLLREDPDKKLVYVQLLNEVMLHKNEILLDHNQTSQILNTILNTKDTQKKLFRRNCLLKLTGILKDNTPSHIKSSLLKLFYNLNNANAFTHLIPCLNSLEKNLKASEITKKLTFDIYESNMFRSVYAHISELTVSSFNIEHIWSSIALGLKEYRECILEEDYTLTSPSILIMKQISEDVFAKIPEEKRKDFLRLIASAGALSNNPTISSVASRIMKKIHITFDDFKPILEDMLSAVDPAANIPKKKKASVSMLSYQLIETDEWRLGVTLLEYVQNKKKIKLDNSFVSILFQLLNKCLRFEEQSYVEYTKQLILSALWYYCKKFVDDKDKDQLKTLKSSFDVEVVVQCIRGTQNPQTHHHALILLSHAAYMLPEQVLHHTMEIFTFMGSSVLRHDDAYSFQIISKIIETLIPILVKLDKDVGEYTEKELKQLQNRVVPILRIFADVVLHVPEHRRLPLFKKLIETLGATEFLWVFLALLLETHIAHFNENKSKNKEHARSLAEQESPINRLDFGQSILLEFPPEVGLENFIKLITYIKSLPMQKDENLMETDVDPSDIFSINGHTAVQLRHYKYVIITFMNTCLASSRFIHHISLATDIAKMEGCFKSFIINVLTFIQTVSKVSDEKTAKYWRVMLHHSYDLLDHTNNLLSPTMFMLVIRGLFRHTLQTVRRKSMELLNSKIQTNPELFEDVDRDLIYSLIPALLDIIKTIEDKDVNLSETVAQEIELNQQTALLSLKLLTRMLASENPEPFKDVLEKVTQYTCDLKISGNVMASIVLCLAELCSNLKAHALASLRKFMPALIKVLKKQRKAETPELVLLSTVTAIAKIVESLPLFLSPYLQKILYEYSILFAKWQNEDQDCSKVSAIVGKLSNIKKKIAESIPPRVLIPVVNETHQLLLEKENFYAIGPVMSVLADSFSNVTTADFTALQQDLTAFFLTALQLRSDAVEKDIEVSVIDKAEDEIVNALVCLVLKLSETNFRPLYFKIYDWAIRTNVEGHKDRAITFYRLSSVIADKLKGLFVLFAGHFIKNAADLLDACNRAKSEELYFDNEEKCITLIKYIIKTLHVVFLYDSQNFLNKNRFETLMQPVVDQLENILGDISTFKTRATELIIPCISQFAVATADDSLWKLLNYQILLKTRHNDADIRLTALECLVSMATQLGTSWLPLLAESVPFLAELLEDGDPRIETSTKDAIRKLEQILGEPLEKYF